MSKPNCREGDARAGCREAARLRDSGARPGQTPLKMLQAGVQGESRQAGYPAVPISPDASSSPGVYRSSSLLPPPAAPAPGGEREGAPCSAFSPLQRMPPGLERRENSRGGNRFYSPAFWTANAPGLLSPSSRLAAESPKSWKNLKPVPNPSAHQPRAPPPITIG